jgi:hypothetical protein
MSSPVKLAGPGNHSTNALSIVSRETGSRKLRNAATRGGGNFPAKAITARPAFGPDNRITATPALPGAVERA